MEKIICRFCKRDRDQVKKMIEGPPDDDNEVVYICDECVDICHAEVHKKVISDSKDDIVPEKMTPAEIKEHLDEYVVGQESAKTAMSVVIYNHYKRLLAPEDDVELEKANMMMIGPTGSGKTHIVKTIARLFDLPYVIADANSFTEAGYVGDDVQSLITRLIQNANDDLKKAQHGIVFIDEIDKIRRKEGSSSANRDVSGEGVQQALLKMVEGSIVMIKDKYEFNTKDILFVSSGAFVGLDAQIKEKSIDSGIGFGAKLKNDKSKKIKYEVKPEDLIEYGMIPEFVSRFPIVEWLDELDETLLVRILKEPKNNLLAQFKKMFKIDGVELVFDEKYLADVAHQSIARKMGARGLRSIIEKTLRDTQFDLPALPDRGIQKVTVQSSGDVKYHYKRGRKKKNVQK